MNKDLCLVLTSCIDPTIDGVKPVARSDPRVRLEDYRASLRWWLRLPDDRIRKILYIDNSGYPLATLEQVAVETNPHGRICEFISLDSNEIIAGLSYGHAEFKLLDAGLKRSRIVNRSTVLLKVTGRYQFPHISRLLNRLPDTIKFAADSVDFFSLGIHNGKLIRFRSRRTNVAIFLANMDFYETHVRKIHEEMIPYDWALRAFVESLLFSKLFPWHDGKTVLLRFPVNCLPVGVGGNNRGLNGFRPRVIGACRAVGRKIVPRFWF